ncbi:hypothetical protein ACFX2J_013052 [Malus domestica]
MNEELVPEALPKEIKSTGKTAPKKQEWQAVHKKQKAEAMPSSSKEDEELAKPTTTKECDTVKRTKHTRLPIHPNVEKKEWAIPILNWNKQSRHTTTQGRCKVAQDKCSFISDTTRRC